MHVMHFYLEKTWYEVSRPVADPTDLVGSLDVSVLQKEILEGMLGITDPRGDPRLHYMGGAKPLSELERLVDSGEYALAVAMAAGSGRDGACDRGRGRRHAPEVHLVRAKNSSQGSSSTQSTKKPISSSLTLFLPDQLL